MASNANSWPEGDDFTEELFGLTKPSSSKINSIADRAIKLHRHYKQVVYALEKYTRKTTKDTRLCALYVIDALLKRSRAKFGTPEKDVFSTRMSTNLMLTFAKLIEVRSYDLERVGKILNSWKQKGIFSPDLQEEMEAILQSQKENPTNDDDEDDDEAPIGARDSPVDEDQPTPVPVTATERRPTATVKTTQSARDPRARDPRRPSSNSNSAAPAAPSGSLAALANLQSMIQPTGAAAPAQPSSAPAPSSLPPPPPPPPSAAAPTMSWDYDDEEDEEEDEEARKEKLRVKLEQEKERMEKLAATPAPAPASVHVPIQPPTPTSAYAPPPPSPYGLPPPPQPAASEPRRSRFSAPKSAADGDGSSGGYDSHQQRRRSRSRSRSRTPPPRNYGNNGPLPPPGGNDAYGSSAGRPGPGNSRPGPPGSFDRAGRSSDQSGQGQREQHAGFIILPDEYQNGAMVRVLSTTLWISHEPLESLGIDYQAMRGTLKERYNSYGRIDSINTKNNMTFVRFTSRKAAAAAKAATTGLQLHNRPSTVRWAKARDVEKDYFIQSSGEGSLPRDNPNLATAQVEQPDEADVDFQTASGGGGGGGGSRPGNNNNSHPQSAGGMSNWNGGGVPASVQASQDNPRGRPPASAASYGPPSNVPSHTQQPLSPHGYPNMQPPSPAGYPPQPAGWMQPPQPQMGGFAPPAQGGMMQQQPPSGGMMQQSSQPYGMMQPTQGYNRMPSGPPPPVQSGMMQQQQTQSYAPPPQAGMIQPR